MFRPSDPDHMLNKTKIIPLISILLRRWESKELVKLESELLPNILKNLAPPLLLRPQLQRAEKFPSSTSFLPWWC